MARGRVPAGRPCAGERARRRSVPGAGCGAGVASANFLRARGASGSFSGSGRSTGAGAFSMAPASSPPRREERPITRIDRNALGAFRHDDFCPAPLRRPPPPPSRLVVSISAITSPASTGRPRFHHFARFPRSLVARQCRHQDIWASNAVSRDSRRAQLLYSTSLAARTTSSPGEARDASRFAA